MDWSAVVARRAQDCPIVRFEGHPPHVHRTAQVVFVVLGGATVIFDDAVIRLGELEALWIPSGTRHGVDLDEGGVLLGPMVHTDPPDLTPQIVAQPELQRIMMLLLSVAPAEEEEVSALRGKLQEVLLTTVRPYFTLRLPEHPAAREVARRASLGDASLEEMAADCFISPRQVQRLFRKETGQSFSVWRTRARLNRVIAALRAGSGLAEARRVSGFATREGLDRAFRRETGLDLGAFVAARQPDSGLGRELREIA